MLPQAVVEWLSGNDYGKVIAVHPVGGGCINNGARLQTQSRHTFFLKSNRNAPADMFEREAEGLNALHVASGPRVPFPYLWGSDFLLLEDLSPAAPCRDYWQTLGQQLARLHLEIQPRFGFQHDNYIGSTPQQNPWTMDGFTFFGEHRLIFQARLAHENGLLDQEELRRVEKLAARLNSLIPSQPAALVHGDLWSGNIITDSNGEPALIDPAAHYGWAEADLAMITLFGTLPEQLLSAYQEMQPLASGLRERFPVYNLYHLLNHLNLFGVGYLAQIRAIIGRFV